MIGISTDKPTVSSQEATPEIIAGVRPREKESPVRGLLSMSLQLLRGHLKR